MKFIVETISTFREVFVVEAETEEIAKKIAAAADYNMSKWLGQKVLTVYPHTDQVVERFRLEDEFFWDGVSGVDAEGFLTHKHPMGPDEFIRSRDHMRVE
jgi:hypothetical protein